MKLIRIRTFVVLALGLALAAPAAAAPKAPSKAKKKWFVQMLKNPSGWTNVKGAAFEMALPREFFLIGETIASPKTPWFGRWRFATQGGRTKLFIRTEPMTKRTLEQTLDNSIAKLKKRASQLTKLGGSEASDELKRPLLIGFYQATLNAKSHKRKKIEARPHLIVRLVQKFPEVGMQVLVTYLFTASKFDHGRVFVAEHSRRLHFHDTVAKIDAIKKLGARFPRVAQTVKTHKVSKVFEQKVRFKKPEARAKSPR